MTSLSAHSCADIDMKKNNSLVLIVSLLLISALSEKCNDLISFLFFRTAPTIRKFDVFWNYRRMDLLLVIVYVFLILTALFSFLRLISGSKTKVRRQREPLKRETRKRIEEADEAIHCAHLTGKEKYLEQIENYLKTGLIDRSEYKVLYDRYVNLNIPDDYH